MKTPGIKESVSKKSSATDPLSAQDHSNYRSGAGLAQYICDKRGDINFAVKEVLRKLASPTSEDDTALKRIARYLKGVPNSILDFPWDAPLPGHIDVYVDSDWCGESETRKSTSGGAICFGGVELKHWVTTQAVISLSSAEAENKAAVKGTVEGLYLANLLLQQGVKVEIYLHSDSSACIGHCSRLGNGKRMRHLEASDLWIQQLVKSKRIFIKKINGKKNPADLFTKHLTRDEIVFHMSNLGYRLINEKGDELGVKNPRAYLTSREESDMSVCDDDICQDIASVFDEWKPDFHLEKRSISLLRHESEESPLSSVAHEHQGSQVVATIFNNGLSKSCEQDGNVTVASERRLYLSTEQLGFSPELWRGKEVQVPYLSVAILDQVHV